MAGRGLLAAGVLILLAVPVTQQAQGAHERTSKELFQTSDRCMACHNTLSTSGGEDISIGFAWRPTMMANSARDPYWQAGVRRETIDHPESRASIEEECSKCHMPMAHTQSRFEKRAPEVFAHLDFGSDKRIDKMAQDGVSCSLCHQIRPDNLGTRASFVGGRLESVKSSAHSRLITVKTGSCAPRPVAIDPQKGNTSGSPSCAPHVTR